MVAGSRRRSRGVVEPGRVPTNGEGMGRSEGRVPGPRNGPPAPGEGIGHPEGRVPGPRNGPPAPKGPPPPTPVNLPAAKGPPQPRPVNPGDIGPMEFAFGDRVVASHLAPFPAPAGPSREEFLVARAVKEDLGLRDETPIMVRLDPDSEAVMAADIVLITVERITPEDMNRRGLAWRHCAFVFDGPENPPPPLVETPPLENGYHCRPNTNSNTAGAEGRVPGGEGGAEGRVPGSGGGGEGRVPAGEGRVPVGCWVGAVRDGPDFDMGVFASDNEEEPLYVKSEEESDFVMVILDWAFWACPQTQMPFWTVKMPNLRLLPMMLWSWTVILNLQWIWTQITPQTSMLGVKKAEDLVWGRYVVVGGMSPSFSPQIHPEPKGS